ncbi:MAG: hypothetical protein ABIN13_00750, partial [Mucilaginibacter sp.]
MMKLKTTLLFALSVITFNSFSQPSLTSDSAYNRAQQARNDARKLWRKHNATNSDFDEAIKILNNAVVYLDSLPVRELAQGNLFLNARKQDVYADMVRAYATEKKYDRLLDA